MIGFMLLAFIVASIALSAREAEWSSRKSSIAIGIAAFLELRRLAGSLRAQSAIRPARSPRTSTIPTLPSLIAYKTINDKTHA